MIELLLTASLMLQTTHPCDLPPQITAVKGSRLGFCVPPEEVSGVEWHLWINGGVDLFLVPSYTSPTTSSQGLAYLEGDLPAGWQKGIYEVQVFGRTAEGTGPLSDKVYWQVGGPPGKPQKPRVSGN